MFSALSDVTDRLDPRMLVAYVLPALVATFAGVGVLGLLIGPPLLDAWVNKLDGFDQLMFALLLLAIATILTFFFKAMRRPILHFFGGDLLPRSAADWAVRREQRRVPTDPFVPTPDAFAVDALVRRWEALLDQAVPLQAEDMKPTRFGNMLANLEHHTAVVHGMDYRFWWPRLAPLLPETMRAIAATETANMTGLLNLSLVWASVAVGGAAVLGGVGGKWGTAGVVIGAGLVLAWVSYRAAIREGAEAGRHLHAAFDLYRHEILKQLDQEIPGDAASERILWRQLTAQMMEPFVPVPGAPVPSATAAPDRTHRAKHSPRPREDAGR